MSDKEKDDEDLSPDLTDREQQVLKDRFGVDLDSSKSLKEVADQFDSTAKKLRAIERRASSPNAKCFRCGRKTNEVRIMLSSRNGSTVCEDCVQGIMEAPDDQSD